MINIIRGLSAYTGISSESHTFDLVGLWNYLLRTDNVPDRGGHAGGDRCDDSPAAAAYRQSQARSVRRQLSPGDRQQAALQRPSSADYRAQTDHSRHAFRRRTGRSRYNTTHGVVRLSRSRNFVSVLHKKLSYIRR